MEDNKKKKKKFSFLASLGSMIKPNKTAPGADASGGNKFYADNVTASVKKRQKLLESIK